MCDFEPIRSASDLEKNLDNVVEVGAPASAFKKSNGSGPGSAGFRRTERGEIRCDRYVFTSYFFTKPPPQASIPSPSQDDIGYIAPWYESMVEHDLHGVVFHDGLTETFVRKYRTDRIQFVRCGLGEYSANDERFLVYRSFLRSSGGKIAWVLLTDSRDLAVKKNPFGLFEEHGRSKLFVGRDRANTLGESGWSLHKARQLEEALGVTLPAAFFDMPLYNAGIIGGSTRSVLYTLDRMAGLFLRCDSNANLNMLVLNYAIFLGWMPNRASSYRTRFLRLLPAEAAEFLRKALNKVHVSLAPGRNDALGNSEFLVTGHPLCSRFGEYESNSDAYLVHK